MPHPYILGLNKYSQSAACALIDPDGEVAFALAKERLTRKKYDGGDVAELVRYCLEQTGIALEDIGMVVENCHLFRIDEFEPRLPFATGVHYYPAGCLDEHNLADVRCLARKVEITHHMAHAYGALLASPFEEGLIVVMDGMGSLRTDVTAAATATYMPEAHAIDDAEGFLESPPAPDETRPWREAESAYLFSGRKLRRVFKRWTPLRSPSLLYNYGFENMESLGAIYSRISSHIFGDWNMCGKVMGLAGYGRPERGSPLMTGPLERLAVDWERLDLLTPAAAWDDPESTEASKRLAATVQADLEKVALDFLRRLREKTGCRDLILTGGVALNSQLNALVDARAGFDRVFVPSAPGDDGVALGCAAFGLYKGLGRERVPRKASLTACLGGRYDEEAIRVSLDGNADRVDARRPRDLLRETAELLAAGKVIGWFQGRSEYGPRALGNRSILAHPGMKDMADRLNAKVKHREPFRPFAPAVLAEEAAQAFDARSPSTYMSFAVPVHADKQPVIPAVVHVDGTARLQHVERRRSPLFYDLIKAFHEITSLPILLNTSFNTAGEAVVETPDDAVWTFLNSEMDALVVGPFLVTKTPFPSDEKIASATVVANAETVVETVCQATGEFSKATLYHRGKAHEAGPLALAILDACPEPTSMQEVIDLVASDEDVPAEDVRVELARLFRIGAVRVAAGA